MTDKSKQWVMVPVEPTPEMIEAGYDAYGVAGCWGAMLAAAPKVAREGLSIQQLNECARDAQIDFCMDKESSFEVAFARRIEAAHGIAPAHGERKEQDQ